jgi:N4-(beta-N-acetylglucosaminyl)-L-asparaginase
MKRRKFIKSSAKAGAGAALAGPAIACSHESDPATTSTSVSPALGSGVISICTWGFMDANLAAGKALDKGNSALSAAIEGVSLEEANIANTTVGKGGAPDRKGRVTLDAAVMDHLGNAGSVACVEEITHVAALARKVMEETPHVMLVGNGAEEFADEQGFAREDLLTPESKAAYRQWLKTAKYKPIINVENHDTIGILTMDVNGDLAGAVTTSGLAYKMAGRVGDSSIIGSGLYVDNEVGAAAATGMGEEIIKQVGSFLIVELMRNGMSPEKACEEAVRRTVMKAKRPEDFQVAYIALNRAGETGSFSLHQGFARCEYRKGENRRIESKYYLKKKDGEKG